MATVTTPTTAVTPGRRARAIMRAYTAEDQALNHIAREAELKLAARRTARAEARDIRLRELEKLQKDSDTVKDREYRLLNDKEKMKLVSRSTSSSQSSRRGSKENLLDIGQDVSREMKETLSELQEKYKQAMLTNNQLDNEKLSAIYQIDVYKDTIEDIEESFNEVKRELRSKVTEYELQKRDLKSVQYECEQLREMVKQRDQLIEEQGLVMVGATSNSVHSDTASDKGNSGVVDDKISESGSIASAAALVSAESALILEQAGEGSLDERLRRLADEKSDFLKQIKKLTLDLEQEKQRGATKSQRSPQSSPLSPSSQNPDIQIMEIQRENNRQLNEYKFKLQKSEQDITALEGNVVRLEGQLKRCRHTAESSEKAEEELKAEKRKMQREVRQLNDKMEELERQNQLLSKRLEKIKSGRGANTTK